MRGSSLERLPWLVLALLGFAASVVMDAMSNGDEIIRYLFGSGKRASVLYRLVNVGDEFAKLLTEGLLLALVTQCLYIERKRWMEQARGVGLEDRSPG